MKHTDKLKITAMALSILGAATVVRAQQPAAPATSKHEFSIYGKAGVSTLMYKVDGGSRSNGFGGGVGLGYTYFFNKHWGLQTGLEMNFYRATAKLDDGKSFAWLVEEGVADDRWWREEFVSSYSRFEEKQRAAYIALPLMAHYQTGGRHPFYASLGVKAALRMSSKYELTTDMTNQYQWLMQGAGPEIMDDQEPERGTGFYPGQRAEGNLDLKMAVLGSVEAGMKWRLSEGMRLYTGLYADIGISCVKKNNRSMLEYTPVTYNETPGNTEVVNAKFSAGSVLNSDDMTKHVRPMAFGVKVGLAFGGKKKSSMPTVYAPPAVTEDAEAARLAREAAEAERARLEAERAQAERERAAEAERLRAEAAAARAAAEAEAARAAQARAEAVALLIEPLDGFGFDKAELSAAQKERLAEKMQALAAYPDLLLILRGHTCDVGSSAYNIKLGERRAESVRRHMIESGVSGDRLRVESRGKEQPLVPNDSKQARQHNRRVEFVVAQ